MGHESAIETREAILPYSGQVVAAVVEALNLDDAVLASRTSKRYFAGQSVSEHSLTEIFLVLGDALVRSGVVPVPAVLEKSGVSLPKILAATMARAATRWDRLCATIQSRSSRPFPHTSAARGFLRLVVVDLALRTFALLRLAQLKPPEPDAPEWAQENGAGQLLRSLCAEAGLTRDQLAARLGVSYTSVDNWLDGKVRPTTEHIEDIAAAVAHGLPRVTSQSLKEQVQRQLTFAHLADLLSQHLGRDTVIDLSRALCRFVSLISGDVEQMDRPPIEQAAGAEIEALRLGTDHPSTHALLRNLALVEPDPEWRRDILAATVDWSLRFQEIANESGWPRLAAGLAQDLLDLEPSEDEANEDLKKMLGAALPNGSIADLRLVTTRHPRSAQAHFALGSLLGMTGKWSGKRHLLDEGIMECKIAAGLRQEWDAPAVEPGIILANAGYYEEALGELEAAGTKLPLLTPHLLFSVGYAKMMLGRYLEALDAFEDVISAAPSYALAFDHAAHCAFMVEDTVRAHRYAKTARNLGEPSTYTAWRRGHYTAKKRKGAEGAE